MLLMQGERVIEGIVVGLKAVAIGTLVFGAWSTVQPGRSIALYQAIMRACNWRVEPIDQRREFTTTRWLGIALTACSLLSLLFLQTYG